MQGYKYNQPRHFTGKTPMHADWLDLPASPGSHYDQWLSETTVSVLADYALLGCQGPDSAKFLQGQLTCNLQDINASASRPGAHCTPKGRMVANFLLTQTDQQGYVFRLHKETLSALHKALGKYIVFSKAKLRDATDEFLLLGLQGSSAAEIIVAWFGSVPESSNMTLHNAIGFVTRISDAPRFECWIAADQAKKIWQTLAQKHVVTGPSFWHWLNIRDGMGEIREQTIEEFIPQMLDLQRNEGISFTKGCYTGQEIVARMQYRGILKKSLYRLKGTGTAPAPATALLLDNTEQASGHIVMAESLADNQWEGLAVIQHEAAELPLHTPDHNAVTLPTLINAT